MTANSQYDFEWDWRGEGNPALVDALRRCLTPDGVAKLAVYLRRQGWAAVSDVAFISG
jgi:hypothetical protein